ncbi:MAG: sulfite exporter TauE/SafE family protein [Oscillospiraceae bacterium]|nr:sulfite exporter TauE/SafE family protein [Oscillospiraceae bacterium]
MLESLPIILIVSVLLGFLAGLGVGGGSLLILWLTFVLGIQQEIARSINLLFFIPSALIACIFRWHQGSLQLKSILPAVIAGCLSAGLMSWAGNYMNTAIVKKLFGLLLIGIGIKELLYRPRKAR